ncbi:MAG TPA: FkbM family methyltransferase [Candidatus Angelobacter sp.]|jgi:FkbM family methyltransferase
MTITPSSPTWRALEFYGTRVHHRGKWRIHNWLRSKLNVDRFTGDITVRRLGLDWCLNPSDFVQSYFYWLEEFETWDWFHLNKLVKPQSIVFDIGANFGFYSLLFAHKLNCQVHAFEPGAQMFKRLQGNVSLNHLNHSVNAVPIGLSCVQEQAYLSTEPSNSGASFIGQSGQSVQLDTLDNYCSKNSINHVDFMKIDVEGYEMRVLRGGKNMIAAFKPLLLIEINYDALARAGSLAVELESALRDIGYSLFISRRKKLLPFVGNLRPGQLINVFAFHVN